MVVANIEDAVLAAIEFFESLYEGKGLTEILLEEVSEKDEDQWEVTIGYSRIVKNAPAIKVLTEGPTLQREYKILTVNKHTGKVESIKIRKV